MNEKPEALRLADALDECKYVDVYRCKQAAAELRRLHAENERLRQIVEDFPPVEAELREVSDRAHRLEQQRDELLEALRAFVSCALPVSTEIDERGHSWTEAYLDQALPIARAAIKAVEGEKA